MAGGAGSRPHLDELPQRARLQGRAEAHCRGAYRVGLGTRDVPGDAQAREDRDGADQQPLFV